MKKYVLVYLVLMFMGTGLLHAQITGLKVEKYYLSDANDATDTTAGRSLKYGSTTYRVFVELSPGCKLRKIYGDSEHLLKIMSTDTFYNNIDRPLATFGYLVNRNWFPDNPLLALDSWLTLGRGAKLFTGVTKEDDTDGSFIGGANNYGGTAGIVGGLIVNTSSETGIAVTAADGLVPDTTTLTQWVDYGIRDLAGIDTTIFGSEKLGTTLISDSIYLQQNTGVAGSGPGGNRVLVAQLTTKGLLTLELNMEIIDSSGALINMVASGNTHVTLQHDHDTLISPFLKYPPVCGCTDPRYLEYSKNFSCGAQDSCHTLIAFGCMDTNACNYDPAANFNLPMLCCYPGRCNDRDIALVCPELSKFRLSMYPNPAKDNLVLKMFAETPVEMSYEIIDSFGRSVLKRNTELTAGMSEISVDISMLSAGIYQVHTQCASEVSSKTFLKN